ncbi:MAG: GIY-YIG nuclease family protein [Candidatus Berkelbacteria bacterium]|nr:GIY-YIG nuclease family protein [Candidatus Berkelbacteria bacterium]
MYQVYALKCANGDLYIGSCSDVKIRINRHKKGLVKSTRSKLPVKLVYLESYLSKKDAAKREKQLKEHKPKEDLKKQIKNSIQ